MQNITGLNNWRSVYLGVGLEKIWRNEGLLTNSNYGDFFQAYANILHQADLERCLVSRFPVFLNTYPTPIAPH